MKNVARRHHFVPQGYLAGFTNDGTLQPAGQNRTFLLGVDMDGEPLAAWVHITRYNGGLFYERSGPGPSGKTMIRKKWSGGEPVLSVETEDEFWKAVSTGEAVEVTRELGEKIGLMEEEVGTVAEIDAARYDPSD